MPNPVTSNREISQLLTTTPPPLGDGDDPCRRVSFSDPMIAVPSEQVGPAGVGGSDAGCVVSQCLTVAGRLFSVIQAWLDHERHDAFRESRDLRQTDVYGPLLRVRVGRCDSWCDQCGRARSGGPIGRRVIASSESDVRSRRSSRFLSRPIGAIRISALGVLPQAAYSLLPYLRAGKSMPSMTLLAASNRSVAMRITSTGS